MLVAAAEACGNVVPAVGPKLPAVGGPALVRVEGVPAVPTFPGGCGALDSVCPGLGVTVAIITSVPSNRNDMTTVNILSPHSASV